jgi:hypothetical protein
MKTISGHFRRRLRVKTEAAPAFVRERLQHVRIFRAYLKYRYDEFKGLKIYDPLIKALAHVDENLRECEEYLYKAAKEEIDQSELNQLLEDDSISGINEWLSMRPEQGNYDSWAEADCVLDDIATLMDRVWDEIVELGKQLQDSLQSIPSISPFQLSWQKD